MEMYMMPQGMPSMPQGNFVDFRRGPMRGQMQQQQQQQLQGMQQQQQQDAINGGLRPELVKQGNQARYKTELCRAFQDKGICKYGDKCQVFLWETCF